MTATSTLVFIAGKDPLLELGGGHSSYVRAHGRAAVRAGFTPHIFGVGYDDAVVATDYGIVHQIKSLWPLPRQRSPLGFRGYLPLVVVHARQIAGAVTRFLIPRPGRHVIHSFGVWGCAGPAVSRRLRRRGVHAIPILNSYTTVLHESCAKLRGLGPAHGWRPRARARAEHYWNALAIDRCERQAHIGSRLIIVNYESVRRLLLARWPVGEICRRLPYASEAAFLHASPRPSARVPDGLAALQRPGSPVIVAVSRHDPRKGLDVLLRALSALRSARRPFHACLVGGGPLLEAHRRLARELGLEACAALLGFVPDPFPYLQHADMFVLPSLEEGGGSLSLLEALQAGLPIVASRCDGISEDVVDGDSALLVPPGDVDRLAAALRRVLEEAELRRCLQRGARDVFDTRFSADVFASALGALYRGYLSEPPAVSTH